MNIKVSEVDNTKTLIVNGVPQSSWPPDKSSYYHMVIPNKKPDTVLLLGLGAGTVARMLLEKFPQVKITGVEVSSDVVGVALKHFDLDKFSIDIVLNDAYSYVFEHSKVFDLIIVDIFDGDNFPLRFLTPKFIRRCQELLTKGGELYINTPNIAHGVSLILPTRSACENTGNIVYKYEKY